MGRTGEGSLIKSISYPKKLGEKPSPDKKSFIEELEAIAAREGKSLSSLTVELWKQYLKVHGSGNPIYPLTNWFDNDAMLAVPALMEVRPTWLNYLKHASDSLLDEIINQARFIMYYAAAYKSIPEKDRASWGFADWQAVENRARRIL